MSLFIALNKQNIKGIFNNKSLIDKTDNCYIMSYNLKNPILDNQETLYIFFQYVDSDYKNLKIFNKLEEAMDFRDKHFKYGHIFGMKQDTYYESLLNVEYFNIQELN